MARDREGQEVVIKYVSSHLILERPGSTHNICAWKTRRGYRASGFSAPKHKGCAARSPQSHNTCSSVSYIRPSDICSHAQVTRNSVASELCLI